MGPERGGRRLRVVVAKSYTCRNFVACIPGTCPGFNIPGYVKRIPIGKVVLIACSEPRVVIENTVIYGSKQSQYHQELCQYLRNLLKEILECFQRSKRKIDCFLTHFHRDSYLMQNTLAFAKCGIWIHICLRKWSCYIYLFRSK